MGRGPEKRFHWPLSALTEELNQFEIAKSRIFTKVVNRFPFKTITYDKLNLHTICCSGNEYAVQKKNKVQGITSDTRTNQGGWVGKKLYVRPNNSASRVSDQLSLQYAE